MSAHTYFIAAAVIAAVGITEWIAGFTVETTARTTAEKILHWILRVAHVAVWSAVGVLIARGFLA